MRSVIFMILAAGVLMTSCAKDTPSVDSLRESDGKAVRFSISVGQLSKAATDDDFKTAFVEGDEIGIFAVSHSADEAAPLLASGNYVDNLKMSFTDGVWTYDGDELFYPDGNLQMDIYAYYPYSAGTDPTNIAYNAAQNTHDLMTARTMNLAQSTDPSVENVVNLYFVHKLALIELNISDGLAEEAKLTGVYAKATLDLSAALQDDEITTVADAASDVDLTFVKANKFRRLIPAQEIPVGDVIAISAGGVTSKYTSAALTQIKSGVARKYTLASGIEDWGKHPNSFFVKPGESVTIPVRKAYAMWRNSEILKDIPGVDLTGALTAELVWQDVMGIIPAADGVTLNLDGGDAENSTITVKTDQTKGSGNAVVCLKIGGTIRWTWHLWITDYDPNTTGKTCPVSWDSDGHKGSVVLMDRNLGATTTTLGDDGVLGFFYQWGRKDPFPSLKNYAQNLTVAPSFREIYDIAGNTLSIDVTHNAFGNTMNDNAKVAFTQPLSFIKNPVAAEGGNNGDWYNTTSTDTPVAKHRWVANITSGKTPFDPCPDGWMVPRRVDGSDVLDSFAEYLKNLTVYDAAGVGRNSETYGNWPIGGRLFVNGLPYRGSAQTGANRGYYHTTNSITGTNAILSTNSYLIADSGAGIAHGNVAKCTGAYVRCEKSN